MSDFDPFRLPPMNPSGTPNSFGSPHAFGSPNSLALTTYDTFDTINDSRNTRSRSSSSDAFAALSTLATSNPYVLAISAAVGIGHMIIDGGRSRKEAARLKRLADEAEARARRAMEDLEDMTRRLQDANNQRDQADARARAAEAAEQDAQQRREEAQRAQQQAERDAREAHERLMAGIPPEFRPTEADRERFLLRYGINPDKRNVAIVGTSGTGKSTFLNSLRGLSPLDPGAAAAGFNETTDRVQGYPDVRNPDITWYDVPGANTPRISGWRYFVDQGLYVFDVLIVVFSDRFTQTAGTLIGNANKCHIPIFLVRTKADQLIQNAIEDSGDILTRVQATERVVHETRETVQTNLTRLGLPNQRVYIVSRPGMRRLTTDGDCSNIIDEQQFLDDIVPPGRALSMYPT